MLNVPSQCSRKQANILSSRLSLAGNCSRGGLFKGFRGLFNSIFVNICLNDTFVIDLIDVFVNVCLNDTFVIWGDLDNLM